MSLQIGRALRTGVETLATRTGVTLLSAYLLVYLVYQLAYNVLMNGFYAWYETQLPGDVTIPSIQPALPVSSTVATVIVGGCLLALTYLTVVMARTFVARADDQIPREFLVAGVGWAVLNVFLGGIAYMLAFTIGLVLLLIPGIIAYVGFVFMLFFVAVEGENFVAGLRHSWNLVRGNFVDVGVLLLVLVGLAGFVGGVFGVLAGLGVTLVGSDVSPMVLVTPIVSLTSVYLLAVLADAFRQLGGPGDRSEGVASDATEGRASPT